MSETSQVDHAEPATATGEPAPWQRLSARMLVVHPVQELIKMTPVLIGVIFAGSRTGRGEWWGLFGVAVTVVFGLLRWFTTTYRVAGGKVEVRSGLVRRDVLAAPLDRVRTVDVSANPLQRLLGLARVTIGTGHTGRRDDRGLRLDALEKHAAEHLRDELLRRSATPVTSPETAPAADGSPVPSAAGAPPAPAAAPTGETVLAQARPGWVRYGAFSFSGLGALGVLSGLIWQGVRQAHVDLTDTALLHDAEQRIQALPPWVAAAELVVAVIVVVAVISMLGYAVAYGNFRLAVRPEGTVHVTRGLLAHRSTTIEHRRLRGVELNEPLLLRLAGGARCLAVTTGLQAGQGPDRGGSLLLPPAPRAVAQTVAAEVLGASGLMEREVEQHGPAAARRRLVRTVVPVVLAAIACGAVQLGTGLPAYVWVLVALAFVAAVLLGRDRYRALGHALDGDHLVIQQGTLVRTRVVLHRDSVVGWVIRRSWFQRRAGLVTVRAATAAGRQRYDIVDVPEHVADRLLAQLAPEVAVVRADAG